MKRRAELIAQQRGGGRTTALKPERAGKARAEPLTIRELRERPHPKPRLRQGTARQNRNGLGERGPRGDPIQNGHVRGETHALYDASASELTLELGERGGLTASGRPDHQDDLPGPDSYRGRPNGAAWLAAQWESKA